MRKDTAMIGAIGPSGLTRPVDLTRADVPAGATVRRADAGKAESAAPSNPVAALVADGAPIDTDKVARLRAAIESGDYPVDSKAIASAMLALDLPERA